MGLDLDSFSNSTLFANSASSISIDLEAEKKAKAQKHVVEPAPSWQPKEPSNYSTVEPMHMDATVREGQDSQEMHDDAHTEEIAYFNQSSTDLYITGNNGFTRVLQSTSNFSKMRNTLIVKKTYRFSNYQALVESINEFKRYCSVTGNVLSTSAKILYRSLMDFYNAKTSSTGTYQGMKIAISIDLCFDVRRIPKQGVYVADLDIVIAPNKDAVHPRDGNFKSIANMSKLSEKYGCTGIIVEIVDNDNKHEPKYLYSAGEVVEIIPVRDPNRENGVTVMRVGTAADGSTKVEQVCKMSVEQALENELFYNTAQAARTSGDPATANSLKNNALLREIEDKRHETTRLKSDIDAAKARFDKEAAERDADFERRKSELERENAELKMLMNRREAEHKYRNMDMAEEFDIRSYRRKEASEFMKYLPGAITGLAAGIGAFMALRK